jgi:transposase
VHGPNRTELTDAQWAALESLLPPQRPALGRPNNDHRQVVEAMVWLARTGSPWRDLPAQYGSWKTVASRFYRWRRDGVFDRLLAEVHRRADACGELDWLCHYVDGSVVRAHQHAAGACHLPAGEDAKRGSPIRQMRPGNKPRRVEHQAAPAHRRAGPLVVLATPGQRHQVTQLERLLDGGAVKRTGPDGRPGRGRPGKGPAKLAADKGYSFPSARRLLRSRGISAVITTTSDQPCQPRCGRLAYRGRNQVERSVGRLKQFRRVATRYDKRAVNYLAWVTLATAIIWL